MAFDYLPLGELIGFVSLTVPGDHFDFTTGRSYLVDAPQETVMNHQPQVGAYGHIDVDGGGVGVSAAQPWIYMYHFLPDDAPNTTTNPRDIERQLNQLISLYRKVNSDGTTGAVGTLTVERWDSDIYPSASTTARLIKVHLSTLFHTVLSVELHFDIPDGGFSNNG